MQCEQVKFRRKKKIKINICHSVVAVGTTGDGGRGGTVPLTQQMKNGSNPSPFDVLCFPDSKQPPIYCWVDRVFKSSDSKARVRAHDPPTTYCLITEWFQPLDHGTSLQKEPKDPIASAL